MWFELKKDMASLYKDETNRRAFATASGRPRGAEKLKKMKLGGPRKASRFGWLFGRRKEQEADPRS